MWQVRSVMERAAALEAAGETHEAARLYSEAAELPATTPEQRVHSWFRAGLLRQQLGESDAALALWVKGAETEGNPEISRRCAFQAACALAASGDPSGAVVWLKRLLGAATTGEPSNRAVLWKLVSVEPASAEMPQDAEGALEALLASEAGFALERRGDLEKAAHAYRLALATDALAEALHANTRTRLGHVAERLALRKGEITCDASVEALHAETWSALQRDDVAFARRLVAQMPPAAPDTAARIGHMLIATAFRLETAGEVAAARELYERAIRDGGLFEDVRTNAAYRLALMLAASGDREQAIERLWHAVRSPDDAVHSAATLHLVHHLIQDSDWKNALALCQSERIRDADLAQLLAVRALQCRVWLDELPAYPEQAAETLPAPVAAHAGAWVDAALACESTDNHPLARVLYERLLGVPELPADIQANVQFRLGLALDRMMMWTGAEPHLRAAADAPEAWPATRTHARYRLAGIYYLLDRYDLALPEYDKLRADTEAEPPVRADAQLKHGMCLYRLERLEEACRDFRTCRIIGGEIELKAELMLAEIAEAERDFSAARESYNRVIQHPQADALTKTAAFQRLRDLLRR